MVDDLEHARLLRNFTKLEHSLAQLEVQWLENMAWADRVILIMERRGIAYPPRPKFPDA